MANVKEHIKQVLRKRPLSLAEITQMVNDEFGSQLGAPYTEHDLSVRLSRTKDVRKVGDKYTLVEDVKTAAKTA